MNSPVKILVECPALIASVRVGVLEPLKLFVEQHKCDVKFIETMKVSKKDISWCDILISVRGCEEASLRIIQAASKAGRYIIYFLDDDLLNIPNSVSSSEFFNREDLKNSLIKCLRNSNVLWCVNNLIGEKYKKYCNNNWVLCKVPTTISLTKVISDKVNILYAGSVDHESNVQKYLTPVIKELCSEFGDTISFTFLGADPKIEGYSNVEYYRFIEDYDKYKRIVNQGRFSIGLAIISTTDFYRCKYYNKFIEYTSIGAVGIFTNSEPYSLVVRNGINGFLCNNNHSDWYNTLRNIIQDKVLRDKCLSNARKMIKEEYNYEVIAKEIECKIPQLTEFSAVKINHWDIKLTSPKITYYKGRLKFLTEKYGFLVLFILPLRALKILIKYFIK